MTQPTIYDHINHHKAPSKNIEVKVLTYDIARGTKKVNRCPIARAIRRYIKGDCLVLPRYVLFFNKNFKPSDLDMVMGIGRQGKSDLPEEVITLSHQWYEGDKIVPFKFNLLIPYTSLKETYLTDHEINKFSLSDLYTVSSSLD